VRERQPAGAGIKESRKDAKTGEGEGGTLFWASPDCLEYRRALLKIEKLYYYGRGGIKLRNQKKKERSSKE